MHIVLLEPYCTGSHKAWAEGYAEYSQHHVTILSLPGNFWKWRMHGGAVTLANKFMQSDTQADLFLATDMLDLSTFLTLTRKKTAQTPTALYFHENQFAYPWSPDDRDVQQNRDKHYGFINYVSALSADAVFFNSKYNRDTFFDGLKKMLMHFPDYRDLENIERIAAKSEVLPLGLELSRFDEPEFGSRKSEKEKRKMEDEKRVLSSDSRITNNDSRIPLILWNHRWEFDKNPGEFFDALYELEQKGLEFEVAVLGECFAQKPTEFEQALGRLGERIVQFGYVDDFSEYARWLMQADILPVTSHQDFFGASVAEAVYCNCLPLLPRRLAYPDLISPEQYPQHFYDDFEDLVGRLTSFVANLSSLKKNGLRTAMQKYDWRTQAPNYDVQFNEVINAT